MTILCEFCDWQHQIVTASAVCLGVLQSWVVNNIATAEYLQAAMLKFNVRQQIYFNPKRFVQNHKS